MSTDHHTTSTAGRRGETITEKGAGLARGPAWITGIVLSVLGLGLFFKVSGLPLSTGGFPDAQERGQSLLGFRVNGWTAWLTTVAGVLLLIGAAQHLAAKGTSLVVGLALGAAAVIALVDGHDVLGLAAANGLTALVWGVAAVVLLANTLAPRLQHERAARRDDGVTDSDGAGPRTDRGPGLTPMPERDRATSPVGTGRGEATTRPRER